MYIYIKMYFNIAHYGITQKHQHIIMFCVHELSITMAVFLRSDVCKTLRNAARCPGPFPAIASSAKYQPAFVGPSLGNLPVLQFPTNTLGWDKPCRDAPDCTRCIGKAGEVFWSPVSRPRGPNHLWVWPTSTACMIARFRLYFKTFLR